MKILKNASTPKAYLVALELMLIFIFTACAPLALKPADFSWPVESVLHVGEDGVAKEERHNITFNAREMFLIETGDSSAHVDKDIRVIRDMNGYVYITSNNFKNVYVFRNGEGELSLQNKIVISDTTGIASPAFNQRTPYIELIDGNNKYLLTSDGIKENDDEN